MTREDLEVVKIEDICQKIVSGGTPSTKSQDFYINGTVPWLKTQEVDFNRIYGTQTYITENALNSSSAKIIPVNSVIIAMYGATAGKIAINKIELSTNQACCNLIINKEKANYNYVFYKLRTMFEIIVSMAFGGAQQNLSVGTLKNIEISLPPLAEQQRIASILSAYDDLIENNTRRIALLEQMAQTLYRQWFVEYKFPGYQDVEMVESGTEFGMIPQGWEVKKIGEMVKPTQGMQVPVGEQYTIKEEGYVQFLRIVDYTQANTDIRYIKNPGTKCFVDIDEIAMIRYGEVGLVGRGRKGIIANNLFKINPLNNERDIKPYIYYFFLQKEVKEGLVQKQNSSTLPSITFEMFNNIALIIPSNDVIKKFNILDNSYFKETINLQKQNQSLKEQRDLLLRKLIG